jgi:glucose-1-phosphatase
MDREFEAIIFDLGGVIINLDYDRTRNEFKKLGLIDFEKIYCQAAQSHLFDDFETGKIAAPHFLNQLLVHFPAGTSPNKLVHAWNAMILDFPKKRLQILDELRKKHRIFLLSNTNEIHLQAVNRSLRKVTERKLNSFFDAVYLSHEMKLRKPHKEIFDEVCKLNQLTPSQTLFIDDTVGHIEGAKRAGLRTHHLGVGSTIEDLFLV